MNPFNPQAAGREAPGEPFVFFLPCTMLAVALMAITLVLADGPPSSNPLAGPAAPDAMVAPYA